MKIVLLSLIHGEKPLIVLMGGCLSAFCSKCSSCVLSSSYPNCLSRWSGADESTESAHKSSVRLDLLLSCCSSSWKSLMRMRSEHGSSAVFIRQRLRDPDRTRIERASASTRSPHAQPVFPDSCCLCIATQPAMCSVGIIVPAAVFHCWTCPLMLISSSQLATPIPDTSSGHCFTPGQWKIRHLIFGSHYIKPYHFSWHLDLIEMQAQVLNCVYSRTP